MLSQALTSDPIHSQLLERVCASESLKEKILQMSTSLQVGLFHYCTQSLRKSNLYRGSRKLFQSLTNRVLSGDVWWCLLISLQVTVLEDLNKPGRKVCVANTHLFWHPKGTAVLSFH